MEALRIDTERAAPNARIHLVGHSVGGVIATAFAHRYPDRVAAMVSVEGNFTLADAFWSAELAKMTPAAVGFTAGPEYGELLRAVFRRVPVHLSRHLIPLEAPDAFGGGPGRADWGSQVIQPCPGGAHRHDEWDAAVQPGARSAIKSSGITHP